MAKNSIPPPPKPEPRKKSKKQKTLLGDKQRAGTILSSHLRKIAQEETEFLKDPEGDRMVTKAEALAELMWKMALGYTETVVKAGKDGTVAGAEIVHAPDRGMIQLIWDRVEGRAVPVNEGLGKRRALPKKVSDANKERLNRMAKKDKNAD